MATQPLFMRKAIQNYQALVIRKCKAGELNISKMLSQNENSYDLLVSRQGFKYLMSDICFKIMIIRFKTFIFMAALISFTQAYSNKIYHTDSIPNLRLEKNTSSQLILPSSLFLSGVLIASVPELNKLELSISNRFTPNKKHTNADDYLQYTPALAVFAADAFGLKGKNKPNQQLLMYGLSNVGTAVIVQSMKRIIGRERPDGSNKRSFPSGHTSTAFAAAEFLHQEFGKQSNWISFAGYAAASATGYLRMYNNAHWLGDVIAGAAIGLGTTKLIYWIKDSRIRKMKRIGVSHL